MKHALPRCVRVPLLLTSFGLHAVERATEFEGECEFSCAISD